MQLCNGKWKNSVLTKLYLHILLKFEKWSLRHSESYFFHISEKYLKYADIIADAHHKDFGK